MIELLRSGAPATMPLLSHLLRSKRSSEAPTGCASPVPPQQGIAGSVNQPQQGQQLEADSPCYSCSDAEAAVGPAAGGGTDDGLAESPLLQADRICQRFGLNQEQAEVLQYVASWCQSGGGAGGTGTGAPPPVCLVHGPFGSGEP